MSLGPPPKCEKIQLPDNLVKSLKANTIMSDLESAAYDPTTQAGRGSIVVHRANANTGLRDGIDDAASTPQFTFLSIAVLHADPLLAYEIIRLGANVNLPDREGQSPLLKAATNFAIALANHAVEPPRFQMPTTESAQRLRRAANPELKHHNLLERIRLIIKILIGQHADVNRASGGITPLHSLCLTQDWELIELLLRHGANPFARGGPEMGEKTPPDVFMTQRDKTRFRALLAKYPPATARPRPPHLCPCWSGKTLAECHANKQQPFPPEFYCPCGSAKNAAAPVKVEETPLPDDLNADLSIVQHRLEVTTLDVDGKTDQLVLHRRLTDFIDDKDIEIDLAFKYALRHVDFSPIPMGSSSTRNADTIKQQEDWNAQVDSYIASGVDSRTKEQIELEAKIGPDHGPLHRRCEGVGCNKLEGRDEARMNTCGKCRMQRMSSQLLEDAQRGLWKTPATWAGVVISDDHDADYQNTPSGY
ncbi:hypothetical protein BDN67DRAFT_1007867 [Paxillus ammoniavirescens]|nr:hypothetical protein BDN67DRAFT_1007867 [Paxillus ammoniavirescens]